MLSFSVIILVDRKDLEILERYTFLGQSRYRVRLRRTNIVFNINAINDEEAIEKALDMIKKIGLNDDVIDKISSRFLKKSKSNE